MLKITDATIPLKQVPRYLGIDVAECTLRRWVREGRLEALKKAGRVYTSRQAIERVCARAGGQLL